MWDSEKISLLGLSQRQVVSVDVLALVCFCITSGLIQVMRTSEDLIFLSNSFFLPFRSGRK